MKLPETYILNKFYSYSIEPTFRKHDGTYNAGCPVCREGKSLGKKKRLFFYPNTGTMHCFNCSRTWSSLSWIKQVSGLSKDEIDQEIMSNDTSVDIFKKQQVVPISKRRQNMDLPYDSINLFDETQIKFYSNNKEFNIALKYLKERRLDVAINRPSNLFVSFKDFIHKNRICIPFYDRNNKIIFYQTRCLDNSHPRYLGKEGSEKSVFNIDKVDINLPYIFIFEGPIDAMFVKNGVSVAGLTLSDTQQTQLSEFPFHKKIWVLDNPKMDDASKEKTKKMLLDGENIFKWPLHMSYKDFNEMVMFEETNQIDYNIILNSLY